jgi:DNA-binding transcriptional MerR regulator
MRNPLDRLRDQFQGNADSLIAAAQDLANQLGLSQEASEGNERLLRHYVSVGVVDKPVREGRDAVYGFRHLVQFLVARRLLADGFPLAKIARYTSVVPTDDLANSLLKADNASEAELLVAAFRAEGSLSSPLRAPLGAPLGSPLSAREPSLRALRKPVGSRPLPTSAASLGMVDVMHELREIEQRVRSEVETLRHELRHLHQRQMQQLEALLNEQQRASTLLTGRLSALERQLDALAGTHPPPPVNDRKEVKP